MKPERKSNGYWTKMSNENLIHYVRSQHYGDSLSEFVKSRDCVAYVECKKRKMKTEDGREISARDFLLEEGTLIDKQANQKDWQNMSNEEFITYMRSQHYGETVGEFARKAGGAYIEVRERKLQEFLIDEGTLVKGKQSNGYWKNMSNENLIHYVRSWHYRDKLKEFEKKSRQAYRECCERKIKIENGKEVRITDFLVEEETLIRKYKIKGSWKSWDNLEKELMIIIRQVGHFPSADELNELDRFDVSNAISKYHGGFPAVKAKMGISIPKTNDPISLLESLLDDESKDNVKGGERK